MFSRRGTSLIEFVLSLAIIAILFTGVYAVYASIVSSIQSVGARNAASTIIGNEIEMMRNLPYANVGTQGGIPAGAIPGTQTVSYGNYTFSLQTTIRNIDDPFDGTLGGTPNDTAPADYKLVSLTATCVSCSGNIAPIDITATIAPKNLESNTQQGSLFIFALDANGQPVSGATVNVANASITPSINLTDTTNASGVLQLVGVPTSTQGYQVIVTKPGYSTDQTYPPGAPSNPNPTEPNLTVANQTVTNATFRIDRTSQVTVLTSDNRCAPVPNESFSMQGTKLIGTNLLKFSVTTTTDTGGSHIFPNIEWDTYTFVINDATRDVAGTIPFSPLIINPSSTVAFRFILQPAADPSLLANVVDGTSGAGISGATVKISQGAFSATAVTGHATFGQSDWSGGQYASESGGIAAGAPGKLTLAANASGTYTIGTNDWLISNTFDVGGTSSTFNTLSWTPVSEPSFTSISFQVAGNTDDATWNFIGPDGTPSTYFTANGAALPASLAGDRYFRYKVFLNTQDPNATPELDSVTVDFTADCVPPAQAFFTGLAQGTYLIDVVAPGYAETTSTVSVGPGEATSSVAL